MEDEPALCRLTVRKRHHSRWEGPFHTSSWNLKKRNLTKEDLQMADEHMRRSSPSPAIRGVWTNPLLPSRDSCHSTPGQNKRGRGGGTGHLRRLGGHSRSSRLRAPSHGSSKY